MNKIRKSTIGIQQAAEVDAGIQWLVDQQNDDGSWGLGTYSVAQTGLAVLKLETYALENNMLPLDPNYQYSTQVQNGLNYLFSRALTTQINDQIHDANVDNPDVNNNGIGVYFRDIINPSTFRDNYNAGIALMAIVASSAPGNIVNVSDPLINGRTYQSVAQDVVDFLAWGQTDIGAGRGGWYYVPVNNAAQNSSDNSVSGWVATGLSFAGDPKYNFGLTIPDFVKNELRDYWINNIQNPATGGSYYIVGDGSDGNILRTSNLLLQMALVGYNTSNPKVQSAINFVSTHWNDANTDPGWKGTGYPPTPSSYQDAFAVTKGLLAMGVNTLASVGDWYTDMANILILQQNSDGSWPQADWDVEANRILSTAWALLAIERVAPTPPTPSRGLVFSL